MNTLLVRRTGTTTAKGSTEATRFRLRRAAAYLSIAIASLYGLIAGNPFEVWGITIRILQLALLAALSYLAVRPSGDPSV